MKALILTISLTIIATLSFAQFPQSSINDSCCFISKDIRAAIIDQEGSFVDVKIAKHPNEVVKIRVKNKYSVIHQTRVRKEEIVDLKFDLANYPVGSYTFEIIRKNEVILTRDINYNLDNNDLVKK